jgi:hypothetical protein
MPCCLWFVSRTSLTADAEGNAAYRSFFASVPSRIGRAECAEWGGVGMVW